MKCRFLKKLKNFVKNKSRVEGSIRNTYMVTEASNLCSHYFDREVMIKGRRIKHNNNGEQRECTDSMLSIFVQPGRGFEKVTIK